MFKRMSKKGLSLALASVMIVGALAGCGKSADNGNASSPSPSSSNGAAVSGKVTASGSSALQPLVSLAAEQFMGTHKDVTVNVTAGGSGKGIKDVAEGVSNIGNSDVEAEAQYKDQLVDHIVCIAPFALITNKDAGVESITKEQAADIFAGKITNWKDVGGKDLKITLVHRQESSGSRKLVKQIIMGSQDFSKDGVQQDASKTVATAVAQQSGAIGYVDVPYITDAVTALKLNNVAYSADTIKAGTYPLYGVEHMYTKGEATGATKAFLDYITNKDFISKPEVVKMGFLPGDLLKK